MIRRKKDQDQPKIIGQQWPKITKCGQNSPTEKMTRLEKAQNQPKMTGNGQYWSTMAKIHRMRTKLANPKNDQA
jgi:hypothetical protein